MARASQTKRESSSPPWFIRILAPSPSSAHFNDKYEEIWALDEKDPLQRPECGESVDDVPARLTKAMSDLETGYQGYVILVVSHGNPLQILHTLVNAAKLQPGSNGSYFASMSQSVRTSEILSQHCQKAFDTGELRQLALEILPVSSEVNYPGSE